MKTPELKLKIINEINMLNTSGLEDVYGFLKNYINGQKSLNDWDSLSEEQKEGIQSAISESEKGMVLDYDVMIERLLKKYKNG
jgi:hypothetical protein